MSRASDDNFRTGWTTGLGLAARVGEDSMLRGEVGYVDLGTERYSIDDGAGNMADIAQSLDYLRATVSYSWFF
ncbi:MAG: hypothetical protein QNI90_03035 [Dinoroseobacter sp.]|nr:hypothetical protein [Dinoroseobacter sp.]